MIHKELNHMNVVQLHHYFEDNLNVYMLLEACPRKVSCVSYLPARTVSYERIPSIHSQEFPNLLLSSRAPLYSKNERSSLTYRVKSRFSKEFARRDHHQVHWIFSSYVQDAVKIYDPLLKGMNPSLLRASSIFKIQNYFLLLKILVKIFTLLTCLFFIVIVFIKEKKNYLSCKKIWKNIVNF